MRKVRLVAYAALSLFFTIAAVVIYQHPYNECGGTPPHYGNIVLTVCVPVGIKHSLYIASGLIILAAASLALFIRKLKQS